MHKFYPDDMVLRIQSATLFIEVPVPSQESERSCMSVFRV